MKEENPTYNGWSNYETWAVHLWLTNEEGNYRYWTGRAAEILDDPPDEDPGSVPARLAEEIREAVSDQCEIEKPTLAADLVNAALGEVDWLEIARALIDDRAPPEPEREMLFSLGMVVATPGAIEGLSDADRAGLSPGTRGETGGTCARTTGRKTSGR